MQHPDEGTIHAWIDGELSADDASILETHLAECADCSALAAEARGLVAAASRIVSALDIVPGDVIPKAIPRRQPWYASTQLRAAAAVVIVAGASLLVVRGGEVKKMERAVQTSAPQSVPAATSPAEPERDQAAVMNAPSPVEAAAPAKAAAKQLSKTKSNSGIEGDFRKERASDATATLEASAHSPVVADRASSGGVSGARIEIADSAQRRRFAPSPPVDQLVVTGVAASTAPAELKKIRADTAKNETVYEVSPGVDVTLTDNGVRSKMMLRAAQAKEAPAAPPPVASPTVGASSAQNPVFNVISWTDKRGHVMVLKGPLSKPELEALRQRLPEDQR